jgi:hypothetical protein
MILGLAVGFELVFSWLIVLFGYEVNVILLVQIKKLFVILFYFYFFIGLGFGTPLATVLWCSSAVKLLATKKAWWSRLYKTC